MNKISLDNAGMRELSRQPEDWWYHHITCADSKSLIALIVAVCFIVIIFGWALSKKRRAKK